MRISNLHFRSAYILQINQLTQQLDQMSKLTKSFTDKDRDVFVSELKLSLQRTQQALNAANDQNRILQTRNESTILESEQKHLMERVNATI